MRIMETPQYIIWWQISDIDNNLIRECETMVRLVCKTSDLRCDDVRLKDAIFSLKSCSLCDDLALEDPKHVIMQCTYFDEKRRLMFEDLYNVGGFNGRAIIDTSDDVFWTLMGRPVEGFEWHDMVEFWSTAAVHIHRIMSIVVKERAGVG